jgi:beta-phosphoglucomutase-like phosphatase (HAD superfamily)
MSGESAGERVPAAITELVRGSAVVLWDFDGVVANTEPVQGRSFAIVLRSKGKRPDPDFFEGFTGMQEKEIWQALRGRFALADSVEDLAAERSKVYLALAGSHLRPAPYVRPITAQAISYGRDNVIVSSGSYRNIGHLLRHWGLEEVFAGVLCHGSPESDGLADKYQRLESALERYPGPALLIEDSTKYLDWAKRRGLRTIGVRHELNDLSGVAPDFTLSLDKVELPDEEG